MPQPDTAMAHPPKVVPGNISGSLAGVLSTIVIGYLAKAGYLAAAAAFLGQPVATLSVVTMAVVGGIVNYGVSHFAGIKRVNDLYNMLPEIKTYQEYPGDKITGR